MKIITKLIALSLLGSHTVIAQCSDAGVCVIGSKGKEFGHHISANYFFGKSSKTDDLTIHSLEIGGSFSLFSTSRIEVLLPWSRVGGPLGSTTGLGDLVILWNQGFLEESGDELSVQIGAKLATGISNSGNLPQSYQPGLGTNDLLVGMSYETKLWHFAIGYQLSRGRSDNVITRLRRGDDLLARIGYKNHVDNLVVRLEVLAIKRLQHSSALDNGVADGNSFIDVSGSDQFQVNLLATLLVPLSDSFSVRSYVAVPLRSRTVNVDGLTRRITLSVGMQASI